MNWTYWCFILWAGSLVLLWRLSPFLCLVSASSRSIFRPFVRAILAMIFRLENKNPACQVCTQGHRYDSGSTVHNYQGWRQKTNRKSGLDFLKYFHLLLVFAKIKRFKVWAERFEQKTQINKKSEFETFLFTRSRNNIFHEVLQAFFLSPLCT